MPVRRCQNDDEFFASESIDCIVAVDMAQHDCGSQPDDPIAQSMAVTVVDRLESIERTEISDVSLRCRAVHSSNARLLLT